MQGNKGQHGISFLGARVMTKKYGLCTVVHQMSNAEYEASGKDYKKYFTIADANGKCIECGRADFKIPRK